MLEGHITTTMPRSHTDMSGENACQWMHNFVIVHGRFWDVSSLKRRDPVNMQIGDLVDTQRI